MAATAKIMLSPLLDLLVKLQKLKAYHPVFFFFYCCYMSWLFFQNHWHEQQLSIHLKKSLECEEENKNIKLCHEVSCLEKKTRQYYVSAVSGQSCHPPTSPPPVA